MRLLFAFLLFASALAASTRPNILIILTDDQGYGDLSVHGNKVLQTPVIDKFSAESMRFDRFYVSPLCAPTRSSLLTGRYSLRTGVRGVATGEEAMRSEEVTIAEALRAEGYHTGIFGKWHNGENYPCNPQNQGFETVFGYTRGHWNNYFDSPVKKNGKPVVAKGFIVDATTDEVTKFIDDSQDKPFLAWVAYTTPHTPFQVPDKYFDKYKARGLPDDVACIYGMCENLDDNVGRLLQHLDDKGLRDNTIVLYLSDNGPAGERYNAGMKGKKGSMDEGGSRVPCFMRWPARFKQPRLIPQIAMHIDLFPTLMELCGLSMPKTLPIDGRSLVPLLDNKAEGWPERELFTQHMLAGPKGNRAAAVRTQQYRAVMQGKGWQLYDMLADPSQEKNIAAEKPDMVNKFAADYQAWWQDVKADANKPRDIPELGHPDENPIELTAPNGRLSGGLDWGGLASNNSWIHNWKDLDGSVTWELNVITAGDYEIELQYLCPQADAGAKIEVLANGKSFPLIVEGTPVIALPSPDRVPRTKEAYEMKWYYLKPGTVHLDKGHAEIQVKALEKPGKEVMQLKALWMRRKE